MSARDTRPWRHLYNKKAWHRLRATRLRDEPVCRMCVQQGRVTVATIVDHIKPHKGDEVLFFDPENLQSLCKQCHDSAKQKAEKRGVTDIGCDINGWPLDQNHEWYN